MTRPVVVDTNVVVAGLIGNPGESPVCRILDGMLAGSFPFLLSTELIAEYRSVLLRDRIRALHGLSPEQIDRILTEIAANAIVRDPDADETPTAAPDRGDDHLWRLLATTAGALLVTGDRALLAQPPVFASVQSPRAFVDSRSR